MNLIITDRCNRSCPYCFAREKVRLSGGAARSRLMSFEELEYCVDFLVRSGVPELKLLGGEPTTHPEFGRFVDAGIARGRHVTVFTNGLWSKTVLAYVRNNPSPLVSFLFNVNEPDTQPALENRKQAESLRLAGARGMLGFNLYRADFDLRFAIELIDRHELKREIRLGVAHPIAGSENQFVSDEDLPRLGDRLLAQLDELERHDILGALDCGFPLCMFPEDRFGRLVNNLRPGNFSLCRPIIDVGPGLTAWPCFPLGGLLNVNLRDFKNREELMAHYESKLAAVRGLGFIDRCLDCKYRTRGQCCGGCVARTLRNWMKNGDESLMEKLR